MSTAAENNGKLNANQQAIADCKMNIYIYVCVCVCVCVCRALLAFPNNHLRNDVIRTELITLLTTASNDRTSNF